MADNYTLCLVGAMDSLWFYQIILFPEPISLLSPKTPQPIPNSITAPSSNISQSPLQNQEFPFDSSHMTPPQVDCNNEDEEHEISLTKPKTRSYSSSPSTPKQRSRKLYYSSSMGTLPNKTMVRNCKSLWDLERQEVKGFIDLGFIFKKEEISPRMMSVIPGLQRLGEFKKNDQVVLFDDAADQAGKEDDIVDDEQEEEEEEEKNRGILRPYLSESWLIKRPDSPLLNLRVPRVSAAADMKKHLRFWARTVASEIQQES